MLWIPHVRRSTVVGLVCLNKVHCFVSEALPFFIQPACRKLDKSSQAGILELNMIEIMLTNWVFVAIGAVFA